MSRKDELENLIIEINRRVVSGDCSVDELEQYVEEYQRLTAPVDYTVPYLYGVMGISAVVCTVLLLTGVA